MLEYLLKNGSEQVIGLTKADVSFKLEELESFEYVTLDGQDKGVNVRLRCVPPDFLLGSSGAVFVCVCVCACACASACLCACGLLGGWGVMCV